MVYKLWIQTRIQVYQQLKSVMMWQALSERMISSICWSTSLKNPTHRRLSNGRTATDCECSVKGSVSICSSVKTNQSLSAADRVNPSCNLQVIVPMHSYYIYISLHVYIYIYTYMQHAQIFANSFSKQTATCTSNEEPIYAHSAKGADVMTLDQPIEGTS